MSKIVYSFLVLMLAGMLITSCKNKSKDTQTNTETTVTTTPVDTTAPVQVSGDETLRQGVQDATKDFPGVNATVNNGEVTLTGTIKREQLPTLMQSVQALNPKKVNNNLTIQ